MITSPVILDATTQPGYSGTPLITLDGSATGATVNGIYLRADNSIVKGFIVHSFGDEGIEMDGTSGKGNNNTIQNNWVGIDATGAAKPNGGDGILITVGASGNQIGGTGPNQGNIIAGNTGNGILIRNAGSDNNIIEGNRIGLSLDGLTKIANGIHGVMVIDTASNNTIGGTAPGAGNVISGSVQDGIYIADAGTDGNVIQGNLIGTNATGLKVLAVGNVDEGISIQDNASNTIIGGNTAAAANVISGNGAAGILIQTGATGTIVQGNYIGTDRSGTRDMGNAMLSIAGQKSGVRIIDVGIDNIIGGTGSGEGNVIAYNDESGVDIKGATTSVSILGNSIHSTNGPGIDLNGDGALPPDGNDVDGGPNNTQNFPVITSASLSGTDLTISGLLDTDGLNTQYRIEIFGNTAGTKDATYGEGRFFLDAITVTTDGLGDAVFTNVVLSGIPQGTADYVTAVATRIIDPLQVGIDDLLAYGDSSEFAASYDVPNVAPVAVDDAYSTDEEQTLVVDGISTDLVGSWQLDEGTGNQTVVDASASGSDGTLGPTTAVEASDPLWTTSDRSGGAALWFDGIDDYVQTTSTELQTATEFTLSAWFKADVTTGAHHILWQGVGTQNGWGSGGGDAATSAEMHLSVGHWSTDNKISFFFGYDEADVNSIDILSSTVFTDTSSWHQASVVVTDIGGGFVRADLYVDGVLEGSDTGNQIDRSGWDTDLRIGSPGSATRFFSGTIDAVQIYDQALGAAEVTGLWAPGVLANDSDVDSITLNAVLVTAPT